MKDNPLKRLKSHGQSVWLDYISRELIKSGGLRRLIEEDGLCGMTTNPAIFEKAIAGTQLYDEAIAALADGNSAGEVYERLSQEDVRGAADEFRALYDAASGGDGYVSLEVNPHLAHDTEGTLDEARRLWKAVARPNVMIKVPATREGLPAIRQLIREGINVNVTLLFSLERYREVAEAYIAGITARAEEGAPVDRVASVASFFLSRIDVMTDALLDKLAAAGGEPGAKAAGLRGQAAVASAKLAYGIYKELFDGPAFGKALAKGAQAQRLLWASTGTKDPSYSDVKYVEPLIGPCTVNTLPPETLEAYRDHGTPSLSIEEGAGDSRGVLDRLAAAGIDLGEVTAKLEAEGVEKFNKPFDKLMDSIKKKLPQAAGGGNGN